jgi:hypothetical protein
MDYQTLNSQNPSFGGGPFPTLPGTPAHLGQPTHSPQQQQHQYADPQARFLQSSPSPFPYGQQFANGQPQAFPNMGAGGLPANGGLMQPGGGLSHSQLQQARGKPRYALCPTPDSLYPIHQMSLWLSLSCLRVARLAVPAPARVVHVANAFLHQSRFTSSSSSSSRRRAPTRRPPFHRAYSRP